MIAVLFVGLTGCTGHRAAQQPAPSCPPENGDSSAMTFTVHSAQPIVTTVDVRTAESVSFTSSWPEGDIAMSLVSPSGRVIDRDTTAPGVIHDLHSTLEVYSVKNPKPGIWKVRLRGKDVSPGGVRVRFGSYARPVRNLDPVAAFSMEVTGGTITVDASASSDSDGEVVAYVWDFGDGDVVLGRVVTHSYAAPGTYRVGLVVKDSCGGLGFAVAPSHVVVP
jgi:PKD repeat protein